MSRICRADASSTLLTVILILSLFFVVSPVPVSAAQEGDYVYTLGGSPAVATITSYSGDGGDIVIPSSLGGYPTFAIGDMAFDTCITLVSVVIPDNVSDIGDRAFSGCSNLSFVTIGSNVNNIGGGAFQLCNLREVSIPDNVISIDTFAFGSCYNLTTVTIGSGTNYIAYDAFSACYSLTSFNVSTTNPNYSSIDGVLYDKSVTKVIRYPGGRVGSFIIPAGVTSIGMAAFSGSHFLNSLTIPESTTSIDDWAFAYCTELTSITIPDNVTTIGYGSFQRCRGLDSVNLGDRVTIIGDYAFQDCQSLASLTILERVTTIGASAFSHCIGLTNVTLGSGIEIIGQRAFADCPSLVSISFLGLEAPDTVGEDWILNTDATIRGHAYAASEFPEPGNVWNGLMMGEVIPGGPEPENQIEDPTLYILAGVGLVALVLIAAILYWRSRRG